MAPERFDMVQRKCKFCQENVACYKEVGTYARKIPSDCILSSV